MTYSFDSSFVQYFGLEGMAAVEEAFGVVNDFFKNDQYQGMSALDLQQHGFAGNYATWWVNQTAANAQIIDLKSITLGMVVNHLGLGNPHRYAFSVRRAATNQAGTQINFNVRLKNYDPITYQQSDTINGVKYSYRLIHDAPPSPGIGTTPTFVDTEEFTSDTSENAWSAVAGILDAFYGNTAIYWTDVPTRFGFGVYYDGSVAKGGQYHARHALTYDDAGGLKYLYRTNNYVFSRLDPSVVLITPTLFMPEKLSDAQYPTKNQFNQPVNPRLHFSDAVGRTWRGTLPSFNDPGRGFWPRRNAGTFAGLPTTSPLPAITPPLLVDVALRGGIDSVQFYHQPFDSLLGITFTATNMIWRDTFVSTNGVNVQNLYTTTPGGSAWIGAPQMSFYQQVIGRSVFQPDIIFVADELGVAPDGVPIAWNRTDNTLWVDDFTNNLGPVTLLTTNNGPGVIVGPMQYSFNKMSEGFEVIWSGEASVVGNMQEYSLWGHIKGPGKDDMIIFPRDNNFWRMEEAIAPSTTVPAITMASDDGGNNPIAPGTLTRTQETLTLTGSGFTGVHTIEILDTNGELIVQTIYPASPYFVSDQRIDIPPGVINDTAEGTLRTIRVVNTIGESKVAPQKFRIETGLPVLTSTSSDSYIWDRAQQLTLRGYGFKSTASGEGEIDFVRIDDGTGAAVSFGDGTTVKNGDATPVAIEVISDTQAVIPINAVGSEVDGSTRYVRVARKNTGATIAIRNASLSVTNGLIPISGITTKPVMSSFTRTSDSTGISMPFGGPGEDNYKADYFRRDRSITVNGSALNTVTHIEIVANDGSKVSDNMILALPNPGVTVDDNGTRILISANTFMSHDADGNGTDKLRQFRVYNAVGVTDLSSDAAFQFNVNTQPTVSGIGAFKVANAFNRDSNVSTGDDVVIHGAGFKAITEIRIVDENGTTADGTMMSRFGTIALPSAGVTVTDSTITIDTQTVQFQDGNYTDSFELNDWRRFKLMSGRGNATSPLNQKFYVGMAPTYNGLSGTGFPNGGFSGDNKVFTRDNGTLIFSGANMGIISSVEIIDINGNAIAGASALGPEGSMGITSAALGGTVTVAANAFNTFNTSPHLLDTIDGNGTGTGRRVRVTTPFGSITSGSTDDFSVSATPAFAASNATAFAGGGYTAATGVYDQSEGNLIINGTNFRGVKLVEFRLQATGALAHSSGSISVNPNSPPDGVSFNAAGTQISFDPTKLVVFTGNHLDSASNVYINLVGAADQNGTTSSGGVNSTGTGAAQGNLVIAIGTIQD